MLTLADLREDTLLLTLLLEPPQGALEGLVGLDLYIWHTVSPPSGDAISPGEVAVIPTVLLLKSAGMARYIDRNIRGISIQPELINRIQKAPDKREECIKIAGEIILRIKEVGMPGVLISAVGWEDRIPQILDRAKL